MDLTSPPRSDASSSARLWFAFLGGMVAYALHLVVGFWIIPAACGTGAEGLIPWVEGVATLVFAVMAVAATVVAVGLRRALTEERSAGAPAPDRAGLPRGWDAGAGASTAQFMATTGILLSGLAVCVIAFAAVPLLMVSPCA